MSHAQRLGAQASRLLSERSEATDVESEYAKDKGIASPHKRASLHSLAAGGTPAHPGAARLARKLFCLT